MKEIKSLIKKHRHKFIIGLVMIIVVAGIGSGMAIYAASTLHRAEELNIGVNFWIKGRDNWETKHVFANRNTTDTYTAYFTTTTYINAEVEKIRVDLPAMLIDGSRAGTVKSWVGSYYSDYLQCFNDIVERGQINNFFENGAPGLDYAYPYEQVRKDIVNEGYDYYAFVDLELDKIRGEYNFKNPNKLYLYATYDNVNGAEGRAHPSEYVFLAGIIIDSVKPTLTYEKNMMEGKVSLKWEDNESGLKGDKDFVAYWSSSDTSFENYSMVNLGTNKDGNTRLETVLDVKNDYLWVEAQYDVALNESDYTSTYLGRNFIVIDCRGMRTRYTVQYAPNGATDGSNTNIYLQSNTLSFGDSLILKSPEELGYKKNGYHFTGWVPGRSDGTVLLYFPSNMTVAGLTPTSRYFPVSNKYAWQNVQWSTKNWADVASVWGKYSAGNRITMNHWWLWKADSFFGSYNDIIEDERNLWIAPEQGNINATTSYTYTFYAQWEPKDVNYTVKHWFESLTDGVYVQDTTNYPNETKTAKVNDTLTISNYAKAVTGFTYNGTESGTSFTLTPTAANNVINVYYSRNSYTLTLDTSPSGSFSATSGAGSYKYGASVTIDATRNIGWLWVNWTKDGSVFSSSKNYTFTMPASDVTLVANAKANTPPVVSVSPSSCEWTKQQRVTVNVSDVDGNLASNSGRYNWFVSMSANPSTEGTIGTYTVGSPFTISNLNGTYYLFVRDVVDEEGAVSITQGTKVNVSGKSYHRFGPYKFDNIAPTISFNSDFGATPGTLDFTFSCTDPGTYPSGLSSSNNYQYYLSVSATSLSGGTWKDYSNGVTFNEGLGLDISHTWHLFVRRVSDNASNISSQNGTLVNIGGIQYHYFGEIQFDWIRPTINVSPSSCTPSRNKDVTITVTERESGLVSTNSYQYYVSSSSTSLVGGSWQNYSSGSSFNIGGGYDGSWYIFVKRVSDNAGNISNQYGTMTQVGGEYYHVFGPYIFDNTAPTATVRYVENNTTLGINNYPYAGFTASSPYALMTITDAADTYSQISRIFLRIYEYGNESNYKDFLFLNDASDSSKYTLNFNMYSALSNYSNVNYIGMKIYAEDALGNVGLLKITSYDFGELQTGMPIVASDIGFTEIHDTAHDNDGDGKNGEGDDDYFYARDYFRVEASIHNILDGTTIFPAGRYGILRIYVFGYVGTVWADFDIAVYTQKAYDDIDPTLVRTSITQNAYGVYEHEFSTPLYTPQGIYEWTYAVGEKGARCETRYLRYEIRGNIFDGYHTILDY